MKSCFIKKQDQVFLAYANIQGTEIHILINISIKELYQKDCKKSSCFV